MKLLTFSPKITNKIHSLVVDVVLSCGAVRTRTIAFVVTFFYWFADDSRHPDGSDSSSFIGNTETRDMYGVLEGESPSDSITTPMSTFQIVIS